MTSKEFFYLVCEMRQAQSNYFRTRDQVTLRAARALEGEVDREIRRVKDILQQEAMNEAACNTDCLQYRQGTCPYVAWDKRQCQRYKAINGL